MNLEIYNNIRTELANVGFELQDFAIELFVLGSILIVTRIIARKLYDIYLDII